MPGKETNWNETVQQTTLFEDEESACGFKGHGFSYYGGIGAGGGC